MICSLHFRTEELKCQTHWRLICIKNMHLNRRIWRVFNPTKSLYQVLHQQFCYQLSVWSRYIWQHIWAIELTWVSFFRASFSTFSSFFVWISYYETFLCIEGQTLTIASLPSLDSPYNFDTTKLHRRKHLMVHRVVLLMTTLIFYNTTVRPLRPSRNLIVSSALAHKLFSTKMISTF